MTQTRIEKRDTVMQLSTELVTGLLNYESMNEFLRLYIAYIKVSNKNR